MRKYIPLLILVLIPLIILLRWFHSGLLIAGGEEGVSFYNPFRMLVISKSLWLDTQTGSTAFDFLARLPMAYFSQAIYYLHLPVGITQALLFFILMITAGISVYYLVLYFLSNIINRTKISFVSALFYLLNPYTLSQVWWRGIYAQYYTFALLPLTLLLFIYALHKQRIVYPILIGLISLFFAPAFSVITNVVVLWSVLFLYLLYYLFTNSNRKKFIVGITYFCYSLLFWSFINAWWLFPFFTSGNSIYAVRGTSYQENIGTLLGVSPYFTFPTIIRLLQDFIFFNPGIYLYNTIVFQLLGWILPLILFVTALRIKRIKELWFFVLIFFVGLFVSLGANPPLGKVFVYVFKHISFLQAFRNPYEKYGVVFLLGYTPLFAYGLISLSEMVVSLVQKGQKVKKKTSKIQWLSIGFILFLTSGIYLWPMWTGKTVAGIDGKVGLAVPSYYDNFRYWLKASNSNESYRVFMTPLVAIGIMQDWNGIIYNGVDSSSYMLDDPVISYTPQIPYIMDLLFNIRKYMERTNIVPMLSLLRTKYLVDRKDVLNEKSQIKNFTTAVYTQSENVTESFCINKSSAGYPSEIVCETTKENKNFSRFRYLHVFVKSNKPAAIEIAISDDKALRSRWDGVQDTDYQIPGGEWKDIVIPLDVATEYYEKLNYRSVKSVEIIAHPLVASQKSTTLAVRGIAGDTGQKQNLNEFSLIKKFGKLDVYEPKYFNPAPEFGIISSVEKVNSFSELFKKTEEERSFLSQHGFLVASQNKQISNRSFPVLKSDIHNTVQKISKTRYLIITNSNVPTYLLLSKTFNSQWKVIPDVLSDDLKDDFFTNLALVKKEFVTEDNHYVVNGYANIWKISGSKRYAVIFLPQVYADIGRDISAFAISLMSIILLIMLFFKVKKTKLN